MTDTRTTTTPHQPTCLRFTEREVTRMKGPAPGARAKSIEYTDTEVVGLKVAVGQTNRATYWFRFTLRGTKGSMRIGEVRAISLPEARKRALEMRAMVDRGQDPRDGKRREQEMPTFAQFVNTQYLPWSQSAKRSYRDDLSRCMHHLLPRFGSRRLSDISTRDIDMMKADFLRSHAVGTTNRLLALMSAIYRQAIIWEVVDRNPCAAIKLAKESSTGQRFLSPDEAARLLAALDRDDNQVAAAALKLLLLTGIRREECLQLKWADVNLDDCALCLRQTKNGEVRWVQLSRQAIQLLADQPSRHVSPWVFPGRDGPAKPIHNVRKTLERAQQAAGITDHVHIHSLRHTAASLAVRSGVPLYTVQSMLGHKTMRITQRYAHLADDTVKAGAQAVADALARASMQLEAQPQA